MNLNTGYLLPYLLLVLVILDEPEALWFVFFFVIPLLDVMFFIDIPPKNSLLGDNIIHRLCARMWFPLVLYASFIVPVSWGSMVSMGVLLNTSLCLADEMSLSFSMIDEWTEGIICDYMGFFNLDSVFYSVTRFIAFVLFMWNNNRLFWHIGSIFVGTALYEYVNRVEYWKYPDMKLSTYGFGHYAMFRCNNAVLLPTSHMWVGIYHLLKWGCAFLPDEDL